MKRATLVGVACIVAVAVGALAIRLPRLSSRPMHPDEANQAYKTGQLLDAGTYVYDPAGHHGPTLYYLTLPAIWLSGARQYAETDEFAYRIVPVVFGVGLILLLLVAGEGLGWPAAAWAAGLAAVSSAMVFYSRYYVQETLLVFFTFGTIVSAWRYARGGAAAWAVVAGLFFGLMYATKETWVLAAAAMVGGLTLSTTWTRFLDGRWPQVALRGKVWAPAAAALAAIAVIVAFYSSFGRNWAGPWDSLTAFTGYFNQAVADPNHIHPWYYYLSLLVWQHPAAGFTWSEGLVVGLAVVGVIAALAGKGLGDAHVPLVRFLAFYTVLLTVLYAVIPYKTPWCVIEFLQPMTVMAGVGAVALVRLAGRTPWRVVVAAVLAILALQLGWQSYWLNFRLASDPRNPYVYAHTSTDVTNLAARVDRLAEASPAGRRMVIKVIDENYWPLPWYLRKFPNVGYWREVPSEPGGADANVIIASTDCAKNLEAVLRGMYNKQALFSLRHGFNVRVYVEEGLWQAFLSRQAPPPGPGGAKP